MKKDYHAIIIEKMLPQIEYTFPTFIKKHTSINSYGSTITQYLRAWNDLKASGRISQTINGYRINQ